MGPVDTHLLAVFDLLDDDHITSKWSWFQDGEEKWMEVITSERVRP